MGDWLELGSGLHFAEREVHERERERERERSYVQTFLGF